MSANELLEQLLDTWVAGAEAGTTPDLSELCRDCPELADELCERIQVLQRIHRLRSPQEETLDFAATQTDVGTPPTLSSTDAELPESIGGYRIVRLLGEGGMGSVYEAEDPLAQRRIAVKVMKPSREGREEFRERFLREARAAAGLHHDNIIPIFQVGEENESLFIAMPLMQGETLEDRMKRERRFSWRETVRLGREIASGLAAAHEKGLIHRDVKPANIWLERQTEGDVRVRMLDFGLARPVESVDGPTKKGAVLGTPSYMAPEQADGLDLDARADLFSLGCVLYRITTGEKPFRGETVTAVLRALSMHEPPLAHTVNSEVPPALSEWIRRLLAKDREQRPGSAQEVIDGFRAIETEEGNERTAAWVESAPGKRRSLVLGVLLVVGLLAIGGGAFWGIGKLRETSTESASGTDPDPTPPTTPPGKTALEITKLTVAIWKANAPTRPLSLSDPEALPVQAGDHGRFEVELNRPAYIYLLYIDALGEVSPMYPWRDYNWHERIDETKVKTVRIPSADGEAVPFTQGPSGIEALVVLARSKPLTEEESQQLQSLLGEKPAPAKFNPLLGAVWLGPKEDRYLVVADRARPDMAQTSKVEDPVQRIRRLVRNPKLLQLGEVYGVCYPFLGQ